jgi:methyl-accepting chemotaxis protein
MTLRTKSIAISALICLFYVCTLIYALIDVYDANLENKAIKETTIVSNHLKKAIIELSLERSVMQATLNLDDPIAPSFEKLLQQQREKSDAGFNKVIQLLEDSGEINQKGQFLSALQDLQNLVQSIRIEADQNLSLPLISRDAAIEETLPGKMKNTIEKLAALPEKLIIRDVRLSSKLINLSKIQNKAWEVREYGGRERTYMAIATARGERISEGRLSEMYQMHLRARSAMDMLHLLKYYPRLPQEIKDKIDRLEKVYFDDYKKVRESILRSTKRGTPYRIGFDEYFRVSTDALNEAVELTYLASDIKEGYLAGLVEETTQAFWFYSVMLVFALSLSGFQIYIITFRVGKRLDRLHKVMDHMSQGETNVDLSSFTGSDELDQMADTVEVFRQNMLDKERMEQEQETLAAKAEEEKIKARQEMADRFEARVQGIIRAVASAAGELTQTSGQLKDLVNQSDQLATMASSEAGSTSANVQSVASAAEEMSATVKEISEQIQRSTTMVADSVGRVESADKHAVALSEASQKVQDVISIISDIAGQINLLALNATIESARAGEAGKGFAVVASEVKNLANQTDKSIQEIQVVIEEMMTVSSDITGALSSIRDSVNNIEESSGGIASAVEEQSATTNEIAANMQSAASGTQSISHSLEQVSSSSSQANTASDQVFTAAQSLSEQSDALDREVQAFLKEVRGG